STGIFEHAPETFLVFQHVDVFEGYLAAGEILTGSRSIRSKIFAENQNGIRAHGIRSSFPKISCPPYGQETEIAREPFAMLASFRIYSHIDLTSDSNPRSCPALCTSLPLP